MVGAVDVEDVRVGKGDTVFELSARLGVDDVVVGPGIGEGHEVAIGTGSSGTDIARKYETWQAGTVPLTRAEGVRSIRSAIAGTRGVRVNGEEEEKNHDELEGCRSALSFHWAIKILTYITFITIHNRTPAQQHGNI
jgi:hypothetical protein